MYTNHHVAPPSFPVGIYFPEFDVHLSPELIARVHAAAQEYVQQRPDWWDLNDFPQVIDAIECASNERKAVGVLFDNLLEQYYFSPAQKRKRGTRDAREAISQMRSAGDESALNAAQQRYVAALDDLNGPDRENLEAESRSAIQSRFKTVAELDVFLRFGSQDQCEEEMLSGHDLDPAIKESIDRALAGIPHGYFVQFGELLKALEVIEAPTEKERKEAEKRLFQLLGSLSRQESLRKDALEKVRWARPRIERAPLGDELGAIMRLATASVAPLQGTDRVQAEAAIRSAITRRFGRHEGLQVLQAFQPSHTRSPFEIQSGRLVLRAADPSAMDLRALHILDGILPLGEVGEVIGDFGLGKTFLLLDFALSVAFGVPSIGQPLEQRPVVYLAYEGERGIWIRIAAWLIHHELLPRDASWSEVSNLLAGRFLLPDSPPQFDHPNFEQGLVDTIESLGAGLVVIDTKGKALGAEQSEDSADDSHRTVGMLSRIAGCGCSIVLAHHPGHADKSRGRGSSAAAQDIDFAFRIDGKSKDFGEGRPVEAVAIKTKNGEPLRPIRYALYPVGFTIDGRRYDSAVIARVHEARKLPLAARVFAYVSEHPGCGTREIEAEVEGNKQSISAEVKRLEDQGAILVDRTALKHAHQASPGWRVADDGKVEYAGDDFFQEG